MGQERGKVVTSDNPQTIRRDIDRTRDEMEGTLEAINDRVNPQRVYERRTGRFKTRWTRLKDSVMGSSDDYATSSDRSWDERTPDVSQHAERAKQAVSDAPQRAERKARGNPLAAGMIAFGVGALIGSALPESEAERQAAREAADRLDLEGTKERLTDRARDVQGSVQDQARDAADDLKGTAKDAAQDVKSDAQREAQRVEPNE